MKVQTINITVSAGRDEVFELLSKTQHVSLWARNFCQRIWKTGTAHKVVTLAGEYYFALRADAATGVVDLFLGERLDEMQLFPLRVVSLPHGAAVTLTYFQPTGMPNEIYDRLYRALLEDMRGLLRRFGGGEMHADGEGMPAFHPNLVTSKFYETWDFYTANLGFTTICEGDVYVHLAHPSGAELGILRHEVDGVPSELVSAVEPRGFWLSIQVADADAECVRLKSLGVEIVEMPEDRHWGERVCVIRDPNGVLIFIAHRIPTVIENHEESLLSI